MMQYSILAISILPFFTSIVLAQDNVNYGYVGTTCSSPDYTIFLTKDECLAVNNPPTGLQTTAGLFYQSGCVGKSLSSWYLSP